MGWGGGEGALPKVNRENRKRQLSCGSVWLAQPKAAGQATARGKARNTFSASDPTDGSGEGSREGSREGSGSGEGSNPTGLCSPRFLGASYLMCAGLHMCICLWVCVLLSFFLFDI